MKALNPINHLALKPNNLIALITNPIVLILYIIHINLTHGNRI